MFDKQQNKTYNAKRPFSANKLFTIRKKIVIHVRCVSKWIISATVKEKPLLILSRHLGGNLLRIAMDAR